MADTLKVACPKCKTVMQVSTDLRGKRIKCTSCAAVIAIPAAKAPAAPAKAVPAKGVPAKATAPQAAEKAAIPAKTAGHDEEWGVIQSYAVERTEDKPVCPFCAHELEEDQVVCLNCGFDLLKRDRHSSRVIAPKTKMQYFIWWLPAMICLGFAMGFLALIIMLWLGVPDFGALDWMQRKPRPDHPRWGYMYGTVVFGIIVFLTGRFALKRFIFHPHPPDQEVHIHKDEEED
jgi:hypothetical protein